MPNKRKYHRRRRNWLPTAIAAGCAVIIVVCVITIVVLLTGRYRTPNDAQAMADLSDEYALTLENRPTAEPTAMPTAQVTTEPVAEATAEPVVEATAEPVAEATAEPVFEATAEPVVEATAQPTAEPAAAEPFAYLPVVQANNISDKRIAVTVDDCFQMENLKTIADVASATGSKLTLFPIGKNVVRDGMAEILQECVFNRGFEIENHTFNHARIFRLPVEEMAAEIWQQRAAVSYALGVNYQQHFFRLMGGDGFKDQRTHAYLKQLGFVGIADWAVSGSDTAIEGLKSSLKPGNIYLFHTTDADTKKLKEFIPYAVSQGYQLVTLNNLFGLPDNEISDISTFNQTMPEPEPYVEDYLEMKKGDYAWSIVLMQQRLCELGYLDASDGVNGNAADGVFGTGTVEAVKKFQAAKGLPVTGVADAETQRILLG